MRVKKTVFLSFPALHLYFSNVAQLHLRNFLLGYTYVSATNIHKTSSESLSVFITKSFVPFRLIYTHTHTHTRTRTRTRTNTTFHLNCIICSGSFFVFLPICYISVGILLDYTACCELRRITFLMRI